MTQNPEHTRPINSFGSPPSPPGAPGVQRGPLPGSPTGDTNRPKRPKGPMLFLAACLVVLLAAAGWLVVSLTGDGGEQISTGDNPATTSPQTVAPAADLQPQPSSSLPAEAAPSTSAAPEPAATPSAPLGVEELAERVVQIRLLLNGVSVCSGSGTIVSEDGLVLTNSHVITQSSACPHDTIAVALVDQIFAAPEVRFEADLLVDRPDLDLAVIRIARSLDGSPVPAFNAVPIGAAQVSLGDELQILGFPGIGGETITATSGTVSGFVETNEGGERSWIKTDAAIAGGNSGGLAANELGELVGIPTRLGTGQGPIVDCRPIADTNGDGQINGGDSCIPAGGFINAVRPVAFAVPLITEARTASPIPISQPQTEEPTDIESDPRAFGSQWSLGVDQVGVPIDLIVSGTSQTTQICLTWQYENLAQGAEWEIVWAVDGQTGPGDIASGVNQGPVEGNFWGCYTNGSNGDPLPESLIEAQWIVDGELIFGDAIFVGEGREPSQLNIVNSSREEVCAVLFAPTRSAAGVVGTDRLNGILAPGEQISFNVGSGRYDVAVVNCLGQAFFSDDGGLEVRGAATLEVPNQ